MLALVEDTARDTVEAMVMATVEAIITVTTVATAIEARTTVTATAPADDKLQSSAEIKKTFERSLSSSFGGEGSSFLCTEAVLFVYQLYDLRDVVSFHQFISDEIFLLHRALRHVALALDQRQFTTAPAGTPEVHGDQTNLIFQGVCCQCWCWLDLLLM